jgi:hypothetical protein
VAKRQSIAAFPCLSSIFPEIFKNTSQDSQNRLQRIHDGRLFLTGGVAEARWRTKRADNTETEQKGAAQSQKPVRDVVSLSAVIYLFSMYVFTFSINSGLASNRVPLHAFLP